MPLVPEPEAIWKRVLPDVFRANCGSRLCGFIVELAVSIVGDIPTVRFGGAVRCRLDMERQAIEDKINSNAPDPLVRAMSRCVFVNRHLLTPPLEWLEGRLLMSGSGLHASTLSTAAIPSITVDAAPLYYTEKQGATPIDPGLSIVPADVPLISAAVRLLGYMPGQDVLSVVPQNGISFWWDSSSDALDLSGSASGATYQAVLRSVTYSNPSYDPSTAPRIAEVAVTNADYASSTASRTILLSAVNDPPGVQTPPVQTTTTGSQIIFSSVGGNVIVVSDPDADGNVEQVTLTADGGTLRLAENSGISFVAGTDLGDTTMTFEGTLDAINASMNGLTFTPTGQYAGTASLEVTANDLGNSGLGGAQIVHALVPIIVIGIAAPPPTVGDSIPPPNTQPPSGPTKSPEPVVSAAPVLASVPIPGRALATAANVSGIHGISTTSASEQFGNTSSSIAEAVSARIQAPTAAGGVASEQQMQEPEAFMPWPALRAHQSVREPFGGGFGQGTQEGHSGGLDRSLDDRAILPSGAPIASTLGLLPARRSSHHPNSSALMRDTSRDASLSWFPAPSMLRELDAMRRRITSEVSLRIWAGTASLLSIGASVAYLAWITRGGSLIGSLLSSIPAWKWVDPIPVLEQAANAAGALKSDHQDTLETIIRDAVGS